jgi:hypothetical protein
MSGGGRPRPARASNASSTSTPAQAAPVASLRQAGREGQPTVTRRAQVVDEARPRWCEWCGVKYYWGDRRLCQKCKRDTEASQEPSQGPEPPVRDPRRTTLRPIR